MHAASAQHRHTERCVVWREGVALRVARPHEGVPRRPPVLRAAGCQAQCTACAQDVPDWWEIYFFVQHFLIFVINIF